ncbi:MAG TPA: hypothetical protein G4O00_00195 [Thermoflexia bacterium]|nr:hypothetical protein [Thermoflexia bacterium]
MPTPVTHLVMARVLIESGTLPPPVQSLLKREWGPFLLGHTAPDVQTVSHQPRDETHFYTLPPSNTTPAYRRLLRTYPELARPERLSSDHAAFLAGYLAHLLVDEQWWREIFHPFFGPQAGWETFERRLFLHNVLRTWMDQEDQARLDGQEAQALAKAEPKGWLPFVRDEDLRAWRDLLMEQLQPGNRVRTAEVFAARMGLPAEAIEATLRSPLRMAHLFRHVPPARLQTYRAEALRRSADLIEAYLAPAVGQHHLKEPQRHRGHREMAKK